MRIAPAEGLLASILLGACTATPPPAPVAALPPPPPTVDVVVAPPPPEPPKPRELTPEEKKAQQQKALAAYRAKAEADDNREQARWTPALHAAAKALAQRSYPDGHAAIQAAIAGTHRKPGNAARDAYRHPLESLDFWGLSPTMTVLEFGPGEGWYTELLAPALAKRGKLIVTSADPGGPPDQESTAVAQSFSKLLRRAPEVYGKVQTIVIDLGESLVKASHLSHDGTVDLVLLNRELHGMENKRVLTAWLISLHRALKPHGILGIEQHRAAPGADVTEASKKGYLPEKWVVAQVEAAGFKLVESVEINANPKDTKDYPDGVWDLPPSFRLGDEDHDRYAAIGESDRMTLKFVKEN